MVLSRGIRHQEGQGQSPSLLRSGWRHSKSPTLSMAVREKNPLPTGQPWRAGPFPEGLSHCLPGLVAPVGPLSWASTESLWRPRMEWRNTSLTPRSLARNSESDESTEADLRNATSSSKRQNTIAWPRRVETRPLEIPGELPFVPCVNFCLFHHSSAFRSRPPRLVAHTNPYPLHRASNCIPPQPNRKVAASCQLKWRRSWPESRMPASADDWRPQA